MKTPASKLFVIVSPASRYDFSGVMSLAGDHDIYTVEQEAKDEVARMKKDYPQLDYYVTDLDTFLDDMRSDARSAGAAEESYSNSMG